MNLRCVFHVPGPVEKTEQSPPKPPPRMPSLVDVDIDFVDEPEPRGRSYETWSRARGWASED
jgi:hypothetical protein